ncbi:MAG: mechanosensitive ion channel family protein [Myxococcaceae bacterium]
MKSFVDGNLALLFGGLAFVLVLIGVRVASEEAHRRDLWAGARWLGLYFVLRLNGFWIEPLLPEEWHAYYRVGWILSFAFGATRVAVAIALWVRRRLTLTVTAKIHRDVLDFVLYVMVSIPILKTQLKIDITTLLGTSAVLSLVLGFALQDTLGNVFSGLSLQLETPFKGGDYIKVGDHEGRVLELGWRSTRIETVRGEIIAIPNSLLSKEKVTNFTFSRKAVAVDLEFGTAYEAAPNDVRRAVFETLKDAPSVLADPAPHVWVSAYGDSAISWLVRFYVTDYGQRPEVIDQILSRLWYRFGREKIEIPFPQRVLTFKTVEPPAQTLDVDLIAQLPLFAPFPVEEARALSARAKERKFGAGERVITEGEPGTTFYVVVKGKLSVRIGPQLNELATLERGAAFGEMSLLTGEPRNATIVTTTDCTLLEMPREVFADHLEKHPERLAQLASLIEERKAFRAAASTATTGPAPAPGSVLQKLRDILARRPA